MKPDLNTLKVLKQAKNDEIFRVKLALELKICPVCGDDIKPFFKNGDVGSYKNGYDYEACYSDKKHTESLISNYTYEFED